MTERRLRGQTRGFKEPKCIVPHCDGSSGLLKGYRACNACRVLKCIDVGGGDLKRYCRYCHRLQGLDEFKGTGAICSQKIEKRLARTSPC